jgi:hypothetical protein
MQLRTFTPSQAIYDIRFGWPSESDEGPDAAKVPVMTVRRSGMEAYGFCGGWNSCSILNSGCPPMSAGFLIATLKRVRTSTR